MSTLVARITSQDPAIRNQSLDPVCATLDTQALLTECDALDAFRRSAGNLYERVRALFFLYAIHRLHLPARFATAQVPAGNVPYAGYSALLERRFAQAIDIFLAHATANGHNSAISSALSAAYHRLAFQTLADQVKRSVRAASGNAWMFDVRRSAEHPLRVHNTLLDGTVLSEHTPVRMDLSHSGWSDIFFLGMDYPEGARVINASIDLGIHGRQQDPRPPVEAHVRVIDTPVLRLTSVDLNASCEIDSFADVFDFARDYLGLLKAAVIASGVVPPGMEGSSEPLSALLARLVGPGRGLELVSSVNDIPKGSRLAVSTTLLAALIAACMRATGQTAALAGALNEDERRLVAARAILGEWLGGSGGGWQDSGGVWPGLKRIEGVRADAASPEHGISRGQLLPRHRMLGADGRWHSDGAASQPPSALFNALQASLVLVHGGMAQNVGPILEMVTEKYLLRSEPEWSARAEAMQIYDEIARALERGASPRETGALTTRNFLGPITTIIPTATNAYTERLIEQARARFGADFWGFWMLGGMSGGGMGFIVAPQRRAEAQTALLEIMLAAKREFEHALPFAMTPVVYDFAINERGTWARLRDGDAALMPPGYYAIHAATLAQTGSQGAARAELERLALATDADPAYRNLPRAVFDRLFPRPASTHATNSAQLQALLAANGFDRAHHGRIRADLKSGKIGLAQNRLPASTLIEDVRNDDVLDATHGLPDALRLRGEAALRAGEAAVFTLAAGVGSRWTSGAGVVKALHPFVKLSAAHRSFLELHLAKTQRTRGLHAARIPQLISTSHLTHGAVAAWLAQQAGAQDVHLSPGRAIGQRLVPAARDLRFSHEETPQQVLDEQKQKVRESAHAALISWARSAGEASDYTDNVPAQCVHPVGHWFEFASLLRNGTLRRVLHAQPALRTLMLHNIDTVGAGVDPALLGAHLAGGNALTYEVIARHLEDRGGGLARVDGRLRIVEGLAMPHEEDEFQLRFYSSNTTWIDLDLTLGAFGLRRADLEQEARVDEAVRALSQRMPTYITLKDVKKRWGNGQEDVFPVAQWEKLWGDMSSLNRISCGYICVARMRGQQLKDIAQLDGWLRDGSVDYVAALSGLIP